MLAQSGIQHPRKPGVQIAGFEQQGVGLRREHQAVRTERAAIGDLILRPGTPETRALRRPAGPENGAAQLEGLGEDEVGQLVRSGAFGQIEGHAQLRRAGVFEQAEAYGVGQVRTMQLQRTQGVAQGVLMDHRQANRADVGDRPGLGQLQAEVRATGFGCGRLEHGCYGGGRQLGVRALQGGGVEAFPAQQGGGVEPKLLSERLKRRQGAGPDRWRRGLFGHGGI